MIRSSSSCAARSGAATSSPSAARACWRRCSATGTGSSRRPITGAPRAAVHTPQYLRFLETAYARWRELPDASEEVVANVHPFPGQPCTYPEHIVGLAGYHMGDTACPIGAGTWEAAAWSAHCATHAAQLVLDGERAAYALCRPPGHHAYVDRANGFCYLNNAAIAAQHLRAAHARVAILDLDASRQWHPGHLLPPRRRADRVDARRRAQHHAVLRRPRARDRRGRRAGYNINRPLPVGTGDAGYLEALRRVFLDIRAYAPGARWWWRWAWTPTSAIRTRGWPSPPGLRPDPGRGRAAGLPTVLVQEGGYLSDDLGPNLASAARLRLRRLRRPP